MSCKEVNVYDYLKKKKKLSLADAMLIMKYLDIPTRNKILECISTVTLNDARFKSTSIAKEIAENWAFSRNMDITTILQTIDVPTGTTGRYSNSREREFTINSGRKKFKFSNARYDEAKNCIYIDTKMQIE